MLPLQQAFEVKESILEFIRTTYNFKESDVQKAFYDIEIVRNKTGIIISLSKLTTNTIRIGYDLVVKLPIIGERSKEYDTVE